jgi:DNA-binding transcriptional LysR family regulator
MFDWNDLRHFLAVARCGSTIAAAKALKVNQSTVHRRLDELEKRLGRQLDGPKGWAFCLWLSDVG